MDRKDQAFRMYRAHRLFLQKLISTQLMGSKLSDFQTSELFTLETLGERPWISMSELAAQLGTAANTTTGIVDRMVKRHLVQRRQSDKDRRVVKIALTQKGEETYRTLLGLHKDYIEGMLDAFTDEEALHYVSLIEKLVTKLENE